MNESEKKLKISNWAQKNCDMMEFFQIPISIVFGCKTQNITQ